ncbi:hypothetical protein DYB30_012452, partial [Aphanomyces astaci]
MSQEAQGLTWPPLPHTPSTYQSPGGGDADPCIASQSMHEALIRQASDLMTSAARLHHTHSAVVAKATKADADNQQLELLLKATQKKLVEKDEGWRQCQRDLDEARAALHSMSIRASEFQDYMVNEVKQANDATTREAKRHDRTKELLDELQVALHASEHAKATSMEAAAIVEKLKGQHAAELKALQTQITKHDKAVSAEKKRSANWQRMVGEAANTITAMCRDVAVLKLDKAETTERLTQVTKQSVQVVAQAEADKLKLIDQVTAAQTRFRDAVPLFWDWVGRNFMLKHGGQVEALVAAWVADDPEIYSEDLISVAILAGS